MGRYARINHPDLVYHAINRGNNREAVFGDEEDFHHYLNTIQRYKKKYGFKLFAFCLMTNHVHQLIKVTAGGSISRIMQSITVAQTRYFNDKYQRCGHVWQGRFMSPIVSEDEHLLTVMRYIEQNPLRAGMVKRVEDYAFSSYRLNVRKNGSKIIDRDANIVFNGLGEDLGQQIAAYRQQMSEAIERKQLERIRVSTQKGGNYVSKKFEQQFTRLLPKRRRRGRPRQNEAN